MNHGSKVAINGFGRVDVWLSVRCSEQKGYEVVAININRSKMLAHLLKYDTAQCRLAGHVAKASTL